MLTVVTSLVSRRDGGWLESTHRIDSQDEATTEINTQIPFNTQALEGQHENVVPVVWLKIKCIKNRTCLFSEKDLFGFVFWSGFSIND